MKHLSLRKGIIAALMLLPLGVSAQNDEDVTLTVYSSFDDTSSSFAILDIRKIAFNNDGITFMFIDGMYDDVFFEYGDVGSIKFSGLVNSIDKVKKDNDGIDIAYDGTRLHVTGCSQKTMLQVFDVSGRPVVSRVISDGAYISMARFAPGLYILKVNNKTFKFNKK